MKLSTLTRLLKVDRYRQRISENPSVVIPPVPLMLEASCTKPVEPAVVTSTKGQFILTRLTRERKLRSGVARIPIDLEDHLLVNLHRSLYTLGKQSKWENLCESIPEAAVRLGAFGHEVRSIVTSESLMSTILDVPLEDLPVGLDGWVAKINGTIDLFVSSVLPANMAFVLADPELAGVYTRIGDHLSLALHNVNRTIMIVGKYDMAR